MILPTVMEVPYQLQRNLGCGCLRDRLHMTKFLLHHTWPYYIPRGF